MGNNDFTINGKVVMDLKPFKVAQELQQKILKIQEEMNKKQEKAQNEAISNLEEEIKLLKEKEKTEKKDFSLQIKKKENRLEDLKLHRDLTKTQKEYNKAKEEWNKLLEKETKLQNAKDQIREAESQRELSKLSAGPRDSARLMGQIKSWGKGGFFEYLADQERIKGDEKLESIEKLGERKKKHIISLWESGNISEEEANVKMADVDKSTAKQSAQTKGEIKANVGKYQAMAAAAQMVANQLSRLGKKVTGIVLAPFKTLVTKVKSLVLDIIELRSGVQTYATSSSLITNAAAREQQIKYGLSSDKNYAFTKAKELLNIKSDEDLMYMNKNQRDRLLQYMDQYSRWYQQMESSGVLESIQEMQMEWAELKEELSMEFLSWVAQNKDTIMTCVRGIFETIKFVANLIMGVVRLLGGNTSNYNLYDPARNSDTVNTTNNNQRSVINNFNINTTNNATGVLGSPEALDQYTKENWSDLAKKVVGAIGG